MNFLDRTSETARLDALAQRQGGGFGVVWGRRRVGKTRLLLEWCRRHTGLYTVADQSSPAIQRQYFAEAVATVFPGFADVQYPDWRALLARLAREAHAAKWRGPLVVDEFPYLAVASAELPSVFQQWVDHQAAEAELVVVIAGSSQHMMQGLVMEPGAPLYGRSHLAFNLQPLDAAYIRQALRLDSAKVAVQAYALWGGVPRYWELAEPYGGDLEQGVDACVLDPLSPLHTEPDRLLVEELPSAAVLRPILDAIGAGANRLSEIAGRMGSPATSLARALIRLQELGIVARAVPHGESERCGKRALYRIADPFFRMWFRVVAPHRAALAAGSPQNRRDLWRAARGALESETWEVLCRESVARVRPPHPLAEWGPWEPAARWWRGHSPEWDVVARSTDGRRLLLGEVKWTTGPAASGAMARAATSLMQRSLPPGLQAPEHVVRAIFVPECSPRPQLPADVIAIEAENVLGAVPS